MEGKVGIYQAARPELGLQLPGGEKKFGRGEGLHMPDISDFHP